MNKFTKKQIEAAAKLLEGSIMDRDIMPGERRTMDSLLLRGLAKKGGEEGCITWKPTENTMLATLTTPQYKLAKKMAILGEINLLGGNTTNGDLRVLYKLEEAGFCILEQSLPSEQWRYKRYVPTDKLKEAFK